MFFAAYVTSAVALGDPGIAHGELKSKNSPHDHVAQATCGQPGLLPCPLQRFMRENVALPLARGETKSIGVSLRKVATIGPSEFTNWSAIASQGAAAAEQGDTTALRSACNACHQAYRAAYRAKYRAQPDWQEATTSFFELLRASVGRSDRCARRRTSYLQARESMSARRPNEDDSGSLFLGPCRPCSPSTSIPSHAGWFACARTTTVAWRGLDLDRVPHRATGRRQRPSRLFAELSFRDVDRAKRDREAVALEHDDQRVSVGQRADHRSFVFERGRPHAGESPPCSKGGTRYRRARYESKHPQPGVVFGKNSRVVDRLALGINENRGGDAPGRDRPSDPRSLRKGSDPGTGRPAARFYGASCRRCSPSRGANLPNARRPRENRSELIDQLFFGAFRTLGDDLVVQHLTTLFRGTTCGAVRSSSIRT